MHTIISACYHILKCFGNGHFFIFSQRRLSFQEESNQFFFFDFYSVFLKLSLDMQTAPIRIYCIQSLQKYICGGVLHRGESWRDRYFLTQIKKNDNNYLGFCISKIQQSLFDQVQNILFLKSDFVGFFYTPPSLPLPPCLREFEKKNVCWRDFEKKGHTLKP